MTPYELAKIGATGLGQLSAAEVQQVSLAYLEVHEARVKFDIGLERLAEAERKLRQEIAEAHQYLERLGK